MPANSEAASSSGQPVFGLILLGGPLSGALIRDIRLANELARRGYGVHVWWLMDRSEQFPLDNRIQQHWMANGTRYIRLALLGDGARGVKECVGRMASRVSHWGARVHALQKRPQILTRIMHGMMRTVSNGVESDGAVVNRLARGFEEARVTHVLPMLSVLGTWAKAACDRAAHRPRYLITFQGYELYVNYARSIGLEKRVFERIRDVTAASAWPAIAVSEDYRHRVHEDIGVPLEQMVDIPPGVPTPRKTEHRASVDHLKERLVGFDPDLPLLTFLGRRDSEKGIDLLLYSAAILRSRGVQFQLAICGPTLFGSDYSVVCQQIAENLRCPVLWKRMVHDRTRNALFSVSRCVVYPSIHREPFGMVPVEVMAHGTPVVVPAYGGVSGVIEANGMCGGLRFNVWDSGDLAETIERLLTDDALHAELSRQGPTVAAYFSVENLADRVLRHLGIQAESIPDHEAKRPPAAVAGGA